MNITQVVPRFRPAIGGMEEHVYQISIELLKRGHIVSVITSNEIDGQGVALKKEIVDGIQIYRYPLFFSKAMREYWLIPGILLALQQIQTDIVHVHGYRCLSSFTTVCIAHFKHVPSVFTPHGIYPPKSFLNGLIKSSYDYTLGRSLLNWSDETIALSEHNVRLLLRMGAPSRRVVIVPNGVSASEYRGSGKNARILSMPGSSSPILLYVGRLDWNKQLEKVVDALPSILKEFPFAKFVVVGPDYSNYGASLSNQSRKLGVERSLVLTGRVSTKELGGFYAAADVFILPSSYEGFGLSMLEAMVNKVPVIASSSGGPGDILRHGVHAWLLNDVTPDQISKSVHAVLTNQQLRESLIKNALELVEKKYTWERVVDQLESIYDRLTSEENPHDSK